MWLLIANSLLLGLGLAMDAFSVSVANGLDDPHMSKGRHASIALVFALFQMAMPMIGWVLVVTVAEQFAVFDRCVPYIALVLLLIIGIKMIVDSVKDIRRARNKPQAEQTADATTTDADAVAEDNTTAIHMTAPIEKDVQADATVVDDSQLIDSTVQSGVLSQIDEPIADDSYSADTIDVTVEQDSAPDTAKQTRKLGVWGLLVQALATSIDALSVGFTIAEYNWAEALLCAGIIGVVTLALCLLGVWLGRKAGGRFAGKAGIVGGVILIAIGIEIFVSGLL